MTDSVPARQKIAIVGSGVSGLVTAYLLHPDHDITLFEANDYIGGHTHTTEVEQEGRIYSVDTGFIVFNEHTYPNFVRLLNRLNVASQTSDMSLSVRCEATGLEYNGTSLNKLFAQRRNLYRPSFHRMLKDILRFYRESRELLDGEDHSTTLGDYLAQNRYSREFVDHHIVPMGAAVWSASPGNMRLFPARYFVQFFYNHGFLNVHDRPQWRTVAGGSHQYVKAIVALLGDRIRLGCPVTSVARHPESIKIRLKNGVAEPFDAVILAVHSDQALHMLSDPSPAEREILGAIPYQPNETVLHTDASLLPRTRRAWASWNVHLPEQVDDRVTVTYDMNILQNLKAPETVCVTLNRSEAIDPERVILSQTYHHPVYTVETVAAQRRRDEINGINRTYYCGAYWGCGLHEDGVKAALRVAKPFDRTLQEVKTDM